MRLSLRWLGCAAALAVAASACGHDKPATGTHPGPDASADLPSLDGPGDDAPDGGPDRAIDNRHVIRVTTADVAQVDVDDGLCSLFEAIAASNSRTAVNTDDCPAGTGNDVIDLPPGTYEATTTLELTETVEIRGTGMNDTVIAFPGDARTCGVKLATEGKTVRLTGLTLRPAATNGPALDNLTGVCVTAGTVRIRHARVNGFTAGGLHAEAPPGGSAKLEIYNSLIDGNRNRGDGGGIGFVGAESSISIEQSSIVNNTSEGMGGGLFAAGGTNANYLINTTFSGNVAWRGGGIAAHILALTYFGVYWTTVVNNRALDIGGGLYIQGESLDAHGTASDSIIVGNIADGDTPQANLNADWAPGFSCTSSFFNVAALARQPLNIGDSCRFVVSDAKLGSLMDMGGTDHLPMHALLPGSPAIDGTADRRPADILEQRDTWNEAAGDPSLGTDPGDTLRWTLFGRDAAENLRADMGAYEFNPRWETELLAVAEISQGEHTVVAATAGFSHGAGTSLQAAASDAFVTYQVPVPEAGRHAIALRIGTGKRHGKFQVLVSDAFAGPYIAVGGIQDGYFATDNWSAVDLGSMEFASSGQKFFKFAIAGKNDSSNGTDVVLDWLSVTKLHGYALPEFPGGETFYIRLPPPFSPFLPLSGDEATREPPGFHDPASAYYFSYGFVWWLAGTPDLSTAALRTDLRDYFTGLCATTVAAAVTLDEPADAPDAGALVARRTGTLDVGMCFGMPVPAATIEVSTYDCPDHAAVIVLVAGQPSSSQVRTDLHGIRDGFSCW